MFFGQSPKDDENVTNSIENKFQLSLKFAGDHHGSVDEVFLWFHFEK